MNEHAVKLESLPDHIQFPPELADRIRFDAATQRLLFRGFMYKADYDRLMRVKGGVEYRRAIEHLFQVSTDGETAGSRWFGRVLTALVAACLVLACVVWWQLANMSHESASANRSQAMTAAE